MPRLLMAPPASDDTQEFQVQGQVEQLAAEYLAQLSAGDQPDLAGYLERLSSDEDRQQLQRLLATAQALDASLPARLRPGMLVAGRYRLQALMGSGGMGDVWRGQDQQLNRAVAIKILNPTGISTLSAEPRFQIESETLAQLKHPNIVAVHDTCEDGDIRCLVMELVDGSPLDQIIEKLRDQKQDGAAPSVEMLLEQVGGGSPEGVEDLLATAAADRGRGWYRAVARITIEILRALESAHGAGVIHRDLKPGNLMLRAGGHPVVVDFGLCGSLGGTGTGDVSQGLYGTPVYLAPEQVRTGRVGSSALTDVYQIGAVLYEFLTLERAIDGEETAMVLQAIQRGHFKAPRSVDPQLPVELDDICLRAMESVPQRRYQSVREFRQDLERYLGGTEVPQASQHRWLRTLRYFGRRHRVALGVSAAAVAGLLLGVSLLYSNPAVESWGPEVVYDGGDPALEIKLRRPQSVFVMVWFKNEKGQRFLAPAPLRAETRTAGADVDVEVLDGGNGLRLPAGTHSIRYRLPTGAVPSGMKGSVHLSTAKPGSGEARKFRDSWRELMARLGDDGQPYLSKALAVRLVAQLDDPSRSLPDPKAYRRLSADRILGGEEWLLGDAEAYTRPIK